MGLIDKKLVLNYKYRVIVAGSRDFKDKDFFTSVLNTYINELGLLRKDTIFISGKARGPDTLIIDYCKEYGFDWCEYEADWKNIDIQGAVVLRNDFGEKYNAVAGHMRNKEMAKAATHLLVFWDKVSKGTKNMIDNASKYMINTTTIYVERVANHGDEKRKSSSRK